MANLREITRQEEAEADEVTVIALKDNVIRQTVLASLKSKSISPEQIRCIIAECKYNDKYELDAFTLAEIDGVIREGYKCRLFIATPDKEHYEKCLDANRELLTQYNSKIEMLNNLDYYQSSHFQAISAKIDAYYELMPDKKAEFLAKVEDAAKEYLAREQRKKEGMSDKPLKRADFQQLKERAWKDASDEQKRKSIKHVSFEAKMVVSWAIQNPDLVTVILSHDFTPAMGVAVGHAPDMNIGFNKKAVILMTSEKKVGRKTPFTLPSRTLPKVVEQVFEPAVKEMMMAYVDGKDPKTASEFFMSLNDLVAKKKASPTSSPISTSPPASDDEAPINKHVGERAASAFKGAGGMYVPASIKPALSVIQSPDDATSLPSASIGLSTQVSQ